MTNFIDYLLGGFSNGAVIALMALALVLVWRSTRMVNFAQVGQAMFTTYIALTVQQSTGNWVLALVVALLAGSILGVVVFFLVIRPVKNSDTTGAIIATFGVLIALQAGAGMIWGGDPEGFVPPVDNAGLEIGGRIWPVSLYDLLVLAVTAVLVIGLTLLFTKTSLGLSMRASAFNPEVARLSGVRVNRMLITGWAIAGATGAIGGVLIAPFSTISPNSFDILLVFAFTAAVIGGLDSLIGAVTFGIGTGLVISLVSGYSDSGNAPIVALVLLALNLLLKPDGVFGHHGSRSV
ncbi:MAG: branched-chain amino acid ABC transporter permease [Candidatus Nanopelagicales bacterium]|jgi:branched-chain amino acid transport system permease protein|nr:branched-chain amino acid ABC transporter permease [Actinomycetes bacterium]MCH9738115.1 branched-chain amino acid ABC transporter permease [Actinomycetes bacterium]MCH9830913.1 branched-chain amino acid ABC transporter permease [Actinomycetes bacterium]